MASARKVSICNACDVGPSVLPSCARVLPRLEDSVAFLLLLPRVSPLPSLRQCSVSRVAHELISGVGKDGKMHDLVDNAATDGDFVSFPPDDALGRDCAP